MATQTRRSTRQPTRRDRRSGKARPYTPVTTSGTGGPRPSCAPGPQTVDHSAEFAYIRKDLFRILLWATILIALMVGLSFLPIGEWLPFL